MYDCGVLSSILVSEHVHTCLCLTWTLLTDCHNRDKTTISYTAVMGLREDTHLHGQDYSNIAMMFVSLCFASRWLHVLFFETVALTIHWLFAVRWVPRGRVPDPVFGTAPQSAGQVSRRQCHAMGCRAGLDGRVHVLCRPDDHQSPSRHL